MREEYRPAPEWWISAVVLALALCYFIDPNPRLDFSAFDTRDAESYLALSRSLATGIGYTRNLDPQYYVPHTTWPPGLPLLLVPVVALAGLPIDLLVVKLGMIAYGAVGIVLAYLYARRLSRSPVTHLCVPLLLALNPYYWHFSRMTDTEMPTVLWAIVALVLADLGWARGTIGHGRAFGFGLVAGFGMLIRGSFIGALLLPLAYFHLRRGEGSLGRLCWRYPAYAAGFLLPFLFWLWRNSFIDSAALGQDGINQIAMILRTLPVDPTSPLRTIAQILSDMRANVEYSAIYQLPKSLVPGLWARGIWDHLGIYSAPVAAVASGVIIVLSCLSRRNLPILVMVVPMAVLNVFYAVGGMTRLWVPVMCLVAMALPVGAERLSLCRHRIGGWSIAAVVAATLSTSLAFYIAHHDTHPYRNPAYEALADLFRTIREHPVLDGNVLTINPQAFALYTGLHAPMAVPAIGVDPRYASVIFPADNWNPDRLPGRLIVKNSMWSLIALSAPLRLSEIRERQDCAHPAPPAFAALLNCPIW